MTTACIDPYAEGMKKRVASIAKRLPKRVRDLQKMSPCTIYTRDAGSVVQVVEAPALPAMSVPKALSAPKFWTRDRLAEDREPTPKKVKSDDGLLPTGGYADVVNSFAAGA